MILGGGFIKGSVPMQLFLFLAVLMTAGCATRTEVTAIGNTLSVMEPDARLVRYLNQAQLPDEWDTEGVFQRNSLSTGAVEGRNALIVNPGGSSFAALRRIHARMLAMPYLTWSWRAVLPRQGVHPVRLVVGLAVPNERKNHSFLSSGSSPRVNRVIEIEWSDSALRRGAVMGPRQLSETVSSGTYIARGGPEYGGRWQMDTADIATIQATLWPDDPQGDVEIRFVGIRALPSTVSSPMAVANLRIIR